MTTKLRKRNEILEAGQEIVMYNETNWKGTISGLATLVRQVDSTTRNTTRWEIIAKAVVPPIPHDVHSWWFGNPDNVPEY